MTPIWHDGPLSTLALSDAPIAWSVADAAGRPEARARRRTLAAELIGHLADVLAADVRLARSAAGAPTVEAPHGWHLSLSGRAGRCLIGVARAPIGVDREPIDAQEPLWDMLTADERRGIRALPADRRPCAWLRRWTIKEAHAKLVGEPRRIAPASIETVLTDALVATAAFEGRSRAWTRVRHGAVETVALWADEEIRS